MIDEFKRPPSLVEATMDGIRNLIINGELSLGQQLTQSYLQKSFGFRETPIREALTQLKAEGIIVWECQKGFRVFRMSEKKLSEFCEFRLTLESQALRSAYKNNRSELVKELKNCIKEFEECIKENHIEKYHLIDTKFHKTIFILSSNRYLKNCFEKSTGVLNTIRVQNLLPPPPIDPKGHIGILKQIEEKNLNLALDELEKLLSPVGKTIE